MPVVLIALLGLAVVVALVVLPRLNEIFYVSIRDGRCLLVRGHLSPGLERELVRVVAMAKVERGAVRAVRDGGRARIVVEGLDEGVAQRIRNAFGNVGFGQIETAQPASSRNVGQVLGFAWLAWLLIRR